MSAQRILRIPRTDQPDASVLLSVRSAGHHPLDLSLLATEGDHPFVAKIDHGSTRELRAASYHGSDAEWQAALSHVLLAQKLVAGHDDAKALAGLDTASAVAGGELTITLRKNISGITQRLGTIRFTQRDHVEIALFEWTEVAATAAAAAQQDSRNLEAKIDAQQKTIGKLNAQLQDLTRAKQDHETALLNKFRELLNGKKLKIRDQQRLLAGARADPVAAAEIEHSTTTATRPRARQPGPSRASKRKANRPTPVAESDSDLDGQSRGQVDGDAPKDRDDETRDVATPEKSDLDETVDEDDDDESDGFDSAPPPPRRVAKSVVRAKGKAIEEAIGQQTQNATKSSTERKSPQPLPPPRALPFSRKGNAGGAAAKAVETPTPVRDGHEDETDDDEL